MVYVYMKFWKQINKNAKFQPECCAIHETTIFKAK